jgi:Flp pilus assembly protein TadB
VITVLAALGALWLVASTVIGGLFLLFWIHERARERRLVRTLLAKARYNAIDEYLAELSAKKWFVVER